MLSTALGNRNTLKTLGWRFEEAHIINRNRIEKLIALLAIGFVWAHKFLKNNKICLIFY